MRRSTAFALPAVPMSAASWPTPTTADGAAALLRAAPRVDILVNNLGIYEIKNFADITDEDWRRYFEINVLSGVRLAREYFPGMLKQNWGRIIFISSESALLVPGGHDPLRHDQDGAALDLAWPRGADQGNQGDGQFGPARPDAVRRHCRLPEEHRQQSRSAGRGDRSRILRQSAGVFAAPDG